MQNQEKEHEKSDFFVFVHDIATENGNFRLCDQENESTYKFRIINK